VSMAAVALAITGGGALSSFETTVLLTVDENDGCPAQGRASRVPGARRVAARAPVPCHAVCASLGVSGRYETAYRDSDATARKAARPGRSCAGPVSRTSDVGRSGLSRWRWRCPGDDAAESSAAKFRPSLPAVSSRAERLDREDVPVRVLAPGGPNVAH
jgi:hypothetical protein